MSKTKIVQAPEDYEVYARPRYSFYRPHARVQFKNELINPVTGEITNPESMTKQSFLEECDLNNILRQFKPHELRDIMARNVAIGVFENLPDRIDYQDALNLVLDGSKAFATLDSGTRARFENDPAQFMEFMADPKNQDEAIKLGLAKDTRPPTQTTPPPAPKTEATQTGNSNKPLPPDKSSNSDPQ